VSRFINLVPGQAYLLSGMRKVVWDTPHPRFGSPDAVAGRYLGSLKGQRRWHAFEVWLGGREEGVLFMNEADISQLDITLLPGQELEP
jgi:hypothetical protein